jgi:hypothetical protein
MSAKPDYVVSKLTRPTGGAATGGFVINLTSSTTPMALSQPKDPTLAQYTFFVSRRREDGRERFRLHMGYFETMQAAEEMLAVVREVYPGAWTSEAPGKKLRPNNPVAAPAAAAAPARAQTPAAVAAAPAKPAAPPPAPKGAEPVPEPAAVAALEPHPFAANPPPPVLKYEFEEPFVLVDDPPEFKPADIPVVHPPAKPVVSASAQAAKPVAPKAAAPKSAATKPAPAKAVAKPATKPAPIAAKPAPIAARPAAPAAANPAPIVAKPVAPAAAKPAPIAAKPAPAKTAPTRSPATPPAIAPKIAAKVSAPALQAAAPMAPQARQEAPQAAPRAAEPTAQMPMPAKPAQQISATPSLTNVRQVIEELDDLSDTQTIRLLERHSPFREGSAEANVDEAIRVIKPEDAQSMLAIKNEVKRNAPVLFAVQLDWSVTPFDMGKVPPLAIFNAYTLYTTEANREGRTWFGLRLGFFSDAVSAKQVAYYVRSDFKTVSVVPVTTIEKERANDLNAARSGIHRAANIKEGPAPTTQSITSSNSGVFKLLEDDLPAMIEQDVDGETSPRFGKQLTPPPAAPAAPIKAAAPAPTPAAPPAKATKGRKPGARGVRRDAQAQVDEETLDQTLEILGANTLEITNDSAGDTGVRHLRFKVDKKGSKFASLIERLSGKK